jgi:hypothetical protein
VILPFASALIFCALNIYLWSLPVSDDDLFFISLPLGGVYFWGVFRLYGKPPR